MQSWSANKVSFLAINRQGAGNINFLHSGHFLETASLLSSVEKVSEKTKITTYVRCNAMSLFSGIRSAQDNEANKLIFCYLKPKLNKRYWPHISILI